MGKSAVALLSFVLILGMLHVVSAEDDIANVTIVAGKIAQNIDFSDPVNGAEVEITCNGNQKEVNTSSDGTYAVSFDFSQCGTGNKVRVSATDGVNTRSKEANLNCLIPNGGCSAYFVVVNLALKSAVQPEPVVTGSGGGGGGSYRSSGGSSFAPAVNETKNESISLSVPEESEEENQGFFSRITGAVIGGGTGTWVSIIVVLAVIAIAAAVIAVKRKKVL